MFQMHMKSTFKSNRYWAFKNARKLFIFIVNKILE